MNTPETYMKRPFFSILQYHLCKQSEFVSRVVLYHIIAWILFIIYENSIFLLLDPHHFSFLAFWFYPVYILQFYTNCYWVLPNAHFRPGQVIQSLLLMIFQLMVFALLILLISGFIQPATFLKTIKNYDTYYITRTLYRTFYFTILSAVYFLVRKNISYVQREAAIQRQLLQSENAYLRAQINPHLLFNTLNFIYYAAEEKKPEMKEAIAQLSEIMQYALQAAGDDGKVGLKQEIENIERYVALYRMRRGDVVNIKVQIDKNCFIDDLRLPPLILLTFIENMFKYGDDTGTYLVKLHCEHNTLYFTAVNDILPGKVVMSHGIGLDNTRLRLANYYTKHDHSLIFTQSAAQFIVELRLNL